MTIIELPAELLEAARLSPEDVKTELAIRLYQQHRLNEEQARQLAGNPAAIENLAWSQAAAQVEMNEFLSWASHDLKSPLNTIIGFTRMVIKGMDGPLNEAQSSDLTTAFVSSQRLLGLLSNLVDMARLNLGQIQPRRVEADVSALLKESADKWKTANAAKPLTMNIDLPRPLWAVDANYFKQVISHLLSYAAARITSGGATLSAREGARGLEVKIRGAGEKSRDKAELDSAMYRFICAELIRLQGGVFDEPQETEDGLALSFAIPR